MYNGCKSKEYEVISDVLHGSNLGPLLFTMFVNDVTETLDVPCLIYAEYFKCSISDTITHYKQQPKIYKICVLTIFYHSIS